MQGFYSACEADAFACNDEPPLYGGPTPAEFPAAAQLFCQRFGAAHYPAPANCPCGGTICSTVVSCSFRGLSSFGSQPTGITDYTMLDTRNGNQWSGATNAPQCQCPANSSTLPDGSGCACNEGYVRNGANCVLPANCPAGFVVKAGMCTPAQVRTKNIGQICMANPCNPATGTKYQEEVVFSSPSLELRLTYNSVPPAVLPLVPYPFGRGWSFNYGMRVWLSYQDNAVVLRPNGRMLEFAPPTSGNFYMADPDVPDRLEKLVGTGGAIIGWKYYVAQTDSVETFDAQGKLTAITQRSGQTTTLTYSTSATPPAIAPKAGLLIEVADPFGRKLGFSYDGIYRVRQTTDPAEQIYRFHYDEATSVILADQPASLNLTSIEFPGEGNPRRSFHYNEQQFTANVNRPNHLTGITDENGVRFGTYQYETSSRVISTEHAGGVNRYGFVYDPGVTTTVTDPLNTVRTYSFETTHGVSRSTGISGAACPTCGPAAQAYDSNGFLQSKTDWNNRVTTYLRQDPHGRVDLETSRTEAVGTPEQRTITTDWHPSFRLPVVIAEPGRTTTQVYDAKGTMTSRTLTDGTSSRVWTYVPTYSTVNPGHIVRLVVDGPRTDVSDSTTYEYYDADDPVPGNRGMLKRVTNALGHATDITGYDANGRPLTLIDPNALGTTLEYWPRGWLKSRTVGNEFTGYEYWPSGLLRKVTLPDGSSLEYAYDDAHRLREIKDNLGNRIGYTTLDGMGNRLLEEAFDSSGTLRQRHQRQYDALNRLWKDIGGENPAAAITEYGYDNEGNLTLAIYPYGHADPLKNRRDFGYDALNRLKTVTDPKVDDATPRGVTQYGYDALDRLRTVLDPRQLTTSYVLDALGDLDQLISPDTGTTNNPFHDEAGNLKTSTDARGVTASYSYDALNRVTRIDYSDATFVTFGWDNCANGKGRLCSTSRGASAAAWSYDPHGRVTRRDETVGSAAFSVQYGYQSGSGRLQTITYPAGAVISYEYHPNGRVKAIKAPGNITWLDNATYHPFGRVSGWTWGNGTSYVRTFDLDARVKSFTQGALSFNVGYDNASRLTSIVQQGNPANAFSFGYDNLDRLTGYVAPTENWSYGYDANGNRKSLTVGPTPYAYTYTDPFTSNRLQATAGPPPARTYAYDGAGNVTGNGALTFGYDARGRLTAISGGGVNASRQYNGLGQRTHRSAQPGVNTVFAYDEAGRTLSEYTVNSTAGTNYGFEYVYLDDAVVGVAAFTIPSGQPPQYLGIFYVHPDHLDTPRLVTNTQNQARWSWIGEPFGSRPANENPAGLGVFPFGLRFPGQVIDKEANLHYNYYRDYSPEIGRYIEADPLGILTTETDASTTALNQLYGYVGGNPLSATDPFGLFEFPSFATLSLPLYPSLPYLGVPITVDRCGQVYAGVGVGLGRPAVGGAIGWLLQPGQSVWNSPAPTAGDLKNFLTGPAGTYGLGLGLAFNLPAQPQASRQALLLTTPAIGFSYSWYLGSLRGLLSKNSKAQLGGSCGCEGE